MSKKSPSANEQPSENSNGHVRVQYQKTQVSFPSKNGTCAADLYITENRQAGIVIMAHGFSAERSWKLPDYAAKFAGSGINVLLFDYRNFGGSPGTPRQLISPQRHREDYAAALEFVRSDARTRYKKIALWGTSFSAGHSVYTAGDNSDIAGLALSVPFLDFWPVMQKIPPAAIAALLPYALADAAAGLFGNALTIPITGDPGELAMLTFPGWKKGILAGVPQDSKWQNAAPARVALELPFFRPAAVISKLKMPLQVIYGSRDTGIPAESVEEICGSLPNAELIKLRMGHIDPFQERWFAEVVGHQTAFLKKCLT